MRASHFLPIFPLAFYCMFCGTALGSQTPGPHHVRRIYVERFVTQSAAEEFREDVIAELRKVGSVSIAPDERSADAILGAAGKSGERDTAVTTRV